MASLEEIYEGEAPEGAKVLYCYYKNNGMQIHNPVFVGQDRLDQADAILEKEAFSEVWTVIKNRYGQFGVTVSQEKVSNLSFMPLDQQQMFFEGL